MKVEWINDPTRFILDVIEEIGERPSDSHTIDRVNNDANYTTGNIRWGTWIDQANNRSNTVWLTYGGVTLSLTLMCEKLDMDHMTVGQRIRKGWTIERALSTPTKFGFHRKEREKQC